MHPTIRVMALAIGLLTLADACGPGPGSVARAQEGSDLGKSARGGALVTAGAYQFEVFFYTTGLRVFPRDAKGAPLDASNLTGTATFYHPNSPQPWSDLGLPPATGEGWHGDGRVDSQDACRWGATTTPGGRTIPMKRLTILSAAAALALCAATDSPAYQAGAKSKKAAGSAAAEKAAKIEVVGLSVEKAPTASKPEDKAAGDSGMMMSGPTMRLGRFIQGIASSAAASGSGAIRSPT